MITGISEKIKGKIGKVGDFLTFRFHRGIPEFSERTDRMSICGIEPVRGWTPDWYPFSPRVVIDAGHDDDGKRPVYRKPTAAERMPVDVLLLKNNGEIS